MIVFAQKGIASGFKKRPKKKALPFSIYGDIKKRDTLYTNVLFLKILLLLVHSSEHHPAPPPTTTLLLRPGVETVYYHH